MFPKERAWIYKYIIVNTNPMLCWTRVLI